MTGHEEAVDQYMHGYCMYLAAALHHRHGLPIGLAAVTHPGQPERLWHAWVELPGGTCLDIQGEQTFEEIAADPIEGVPGLEFRIVRGAPVVLLERLAGCPLGPDDADVVEAGRAALTHLSGHTPRSEDTRAKTAGLPEPPERGRVRTHGPPQPCASRGRGSDTAVPEVGGGVHPGRR